MISIRQNLLMWLLSALILIAFIASAATYLKAREEVNELFDYQLRQIALSLRHQQTFQAAIPMDKGEGEEEADFIVRVVDAHGRVIFSSSPKMTLPLAPRLGYTSLHWRNDQYRTYSLTDDGRTIEVTQPLDDRGEMARDIAMRIILPALGVLPVMAILIWLAVGHSLRPVEEITCALKKRDSNSLEPLSDTALPGEIKPMVQALNDLLERLQRTLALQRQFVADAAHELRTPLAALQLQAQVAERARGKGDREAALAQLKAGVQRATHMVQQLLTLSRLEPDAPRQPFVNVDLNDLARSTVIHYAPLAEAKQIDLGFTNGISVGIEGDQVTLGIMLGNLIDNAIRYTPEGGHVDVSVRREDGHVLLEVLDTGIGIPIADRKRVFDRFYRRLGHDGSGSGLGLAIVRNIVEAHGATIALDEGTNLAGLKVIVTFRGV